VGTRPLVRACILEHGLLVGLLIAILYNSSVLILSWLFFTLYLMLKRRCKWNNTLKDSIRYSLVATLGLYALITWILNSINDVSVLLIHSDPHLIAATLELWTNTTSYLLLAFFLIFFFGFHAHTTAFSSRSGEELLQTIHIAVIYCDRRFFLKP